MEEMVGELNNWNFDMWKFNIITKDHPLVALSYIVLTVSPLTLHNHLVLYMRGLLSLRVTPSIVYTRVAIIAGNTEYCIYAGCYHCG